MMKAKDTAVDKPAKKTNVGLNLLWILLTLGVVMDHFFSASKGTGLPKCFSPFLTQLTTLAVPAFMTMTLLFTARHFIACDGAWVKKRFFRLYEPFLFWAIVYFLDPGLATGNTMITL